MESKQKILLVHNYYKLPGGEDTVVENEKRLLERQGHYVFLYARNNKEMDGFSAWRKLLLPLTSLFSLRTYREVKRLIREKKIDIVHVHNTLALVSPSVYYAALRCGTPVVQTLHNYRLVCPNGLLYRDGHICEECIEKGYRCAVKHACYRNSRIQSLISVLVLRVHGFLGTYNRLNLICLTDFQKGKTARRFPKARIFVKSNFTDCPDSADCSDSTDQQDSADCPDSTDQPDSADCSDSTDQQDSADCSDSTDQQDSADCSDSTDRPDSADQADDEICFTENLKAGHYIYVGRMEKNKGIWVLLKAFEQLDEENISLLLVGTGPEEKKIRRYLDRKRMRQVQYCGFQEKAWVMEHLKNARALILPSQCYETFGMTVIESFSCKTPVIISDIEALADSVREQGAGLIFRHDSPADLCDKILEMEKKPDFVKRAGLRAYRAWEECYGPAANLHRLEEIYNEVLKAAPSGL